MDGVTDIEEGRLNQRVKLTMAQWPTLKEAMGCVDCGVLFRYAIENRCPKCKSQSVYDVAHFFNFRR